MQIEYTGLDCPKKIYKSEPTGNGETIYIYQNCGTDCALCRIEETARGKRFAIYCGCDRITLPYPKQEAK